MHDLPDRVAAQGIAGMYADAHDIARVSGSWVEWFYRFIDQNGITEDGRRRRRQNEEPARRNNGRAKGVIAGID